MTIYRFCPNLLQFYLKKNTLKYFYLSFFSFGDHRNVSINTKLLLGFPIKIIDFFFRSLRSNELLNTNQKHILSICVSIYYIHHTKFFIGF